jgi:putative Holliday junction resolvase
MPKKTKSRNKDDILLCIDFGKVNIGTAIGRNGLVTPLEVISGINMHTALYKINRIIVENEVDKLVVGLPLTPDNKETTQSLETRRFAKILKVTTKRPVDFQNEYGSTRLASNEASDLGVYWRKNKSSDHLVAALILKTYYDESV